MIESYKVCDQEKLNDTTHLNIMLTNRCQNKCWYCYADHGKQEMSQKTFVKLLDYINKQDNNYVDINLIGGEPTIHPNFPHFLKELSSIDNSDIHITTNLMKLNYSLPKNVTLTASYHSEWADNKWFDRARTVNNQGNLECVLLIVQESNVDHIRDIWNENKDLPLLVQVITQHDIDVSDMEEHVEQSDNYDQKNVEVLLKDGTRDDENYNEYNNFKGMMCSNGFVVMPDGNIHYCWNCKSPCGSLDNPPKTRWHICRNELCHNDYEFQKCSIEHYIRNIK